jgi:hypothetical protein
LVYSADSDISIASITWRAVSMSLGKWIVNSTIVKKRKNILQLDIPILPITQCPSHLLFIHQLVFYYYYFTIYI